MKKAAKEPSAQGHVQSGKANLGSSWMQKNEVNLQKGRVLNFQLGLILAMALVYFSLEATFDISEKEGLYTAGHMYEEPLILVPEIPAFNQDRKIEYREKKSLVNPKIVIDEPSDPDDVSSIIEPVVSRFPDLPLDSIGYTDPSKDEPQTILISLVDQVPVFPGCETVAREDQLSCFNEQMAAHIRKHFKYPEAAIDLGIRGKVNVSFTIDERGMISSLEMRGPSTILEKEAERIILKLPAMSPGRQGGKPVRVPYSLPISFVLN
jgi:protein TonB